MPCSPCPQATLGARIADSVADTMGSWRFIIIQSIIVFAWIALNSVGWFLWKWDAAPFILLNLIFSTQAAYASPLIMMSQNRQAAKDRAMAAEDLETNELAESRIEQMMKHLDDQDKAMLGILTKLNSQEDLMMQLIEAKQGKP